jgi:penicillin-binding protein 2
MMYLRDENRPPATSQFTFRVAILSGIALVLFSIVFLRLWYLQVLSGDKYLAEAQNNQVREIRVQAPRGEIVDRNGKVLVDNRTALSLQVEPQDLAKRHRDRKQELRRVSELAKLSLAETQKQIRQQTKELPANPVTLRRDVGYPLVYYLQEHQADFPGVTVERVFVRRYPRGSFAAHLLGTVGEVTEDQLSEPRYESLQPGDQLGQTGVEYQYDHLLRGQPGSTRLQVDALGRPKGGELSSQQATAGDDLQLTLDSDVQEAGESALSSFGGLPGAFVAMNIHNGEILGMGSYPTYDPTLFTKPTIPQSTLDQLDSESAEYPLSNRAIQGLYPTGSTFKPITATAALEDGLITPDTIINDTGSLKLDTQVFKNAGGAVYGPLALRDALRVSSDVFFYNLGLDAEQEGGNPIQRWAKALGLGELTGIDLPAESEGLIPTPEWRNQLFKQDTDPSSPGGEEVVLDKGETIDRPWSAGDGVNLSVGQGDLQTDPLQMAVAYATIANGGDVVRPHVAQQVEDPGGRVIQEIRPAARRHVDISPQYRQAILEGIHGAAMEPGGTSYPVFGNWKTDIAGKTGTAERGDLPDQSWYVALAPYPNPNIVVAVTIERGGFGADSAAPAAAQILASYLNVKPGAPASTAPPAPAAPATGSYD